MEMCRIIWCFNGSAARIARAAGQIFVQLSLLYHHLPHYCPRSDPEIRPQKRVAMSSKHTLEDQRLIDSLPTGVFTAFRSSIYKSTHVTANAHLFITHDWIDLVQLRNFLKRGDAHSPPPESPPTRVKLENDMSATRCLTAEHDKAPVKTRLLKEGEREVVEILSDSEVESEADDSVTVYQGADPERQATDESDKLTDLQKSDTIWQDQQITSQLASIYPIPKTVTAFVIDVDDPKFAITDKRGDLYTVNALIKNKDNDSWKGNTGTGDSKVWVPFGPGDPILCCRSRLACKGAFVYAVFAAQRQTRREEGTTAERKIAEFIDVVKKQKCCEIDDKGIKCSGKPFLQPKKQMLRGHSFWIACTGWRKDFKKHCIWSIPDDVDETLFIAAFSGDAVAADSSKDTAPCSAVVHPNTGLKQRHCPHAHIVAGKPISSAIVNRPCEATRTIYVPVDPSIRKAIIVHPTNTTHNHPMPALTKASFELKASYRECIKAAGCVGATVAKVENADINFGTSSIHTNSAGR
ncbi:hypothetical protein C8R44DRAFT_730272 [Mycena epipterygia]|nr:hypothetical protein C8R44DRAFT_730272 [Mycena epipterygia]